MHLFTYGTLMFPEVWRAVVGREFASAAASILGFAVYRVEGGVYPVMMADTAESRVAGLVYFDVDEAALAALDEYESTLYDRIAVEATLAGGEPVPCQAYVLPGSRAQHASNEPWDPERFRRKDFEDYLLRLH